MEPTAAAAKEIWELVACIPEEMRACGGFANVR